MEWRETKAGQPRGGYSRRKMAGEIVRRPRKTVGDLVHGEFSYIPYFPDYKSHLNISRTPLFLPKIWVKNIDKSHLSISRTLFCYFLARRNVLGCVHVMRRSAKERQDAINDKSRCVYMCICI